MSVVIDMETERVERARVVAEARSWIGTPYHHQGRVRGVACDCAMLLLEAFAGAGIVKRVDVDPYTSDWHMHRGEERYLEMVERYCRRVDQDEASYLERISTDSSFCVVPGDILVWRIGRTFSHGAIVSKWPSIIHAYFPSQMVEEEELQRLRALCHRPMRVYSFWRRD